MQVTCVMTAIVPMYSVGAVVTQADLAAMEQEQRPCCYMKHFPADGYKWSTSPMLCSPGDTAALLFPC